VRPTKTPRQWPTTTRWPTAARCRRRCNSRRSSGRGDRRHLPDAVPSDSTVTICASATGSVRATARYGDETAAAMPRTPQRSPVGGTTTRRRHDIPTRSRWQQLSIHQDYAATGGEVSASARCQPPNAAITLLRAAGRWYYTRFEGCMRFFPSRSCSTRKVLAPNPYRLGDAIRRSQATRNLGNHT